MEIRTHKDIKSQLEETHKNAVVYKGDETNGTSGDVLSVQC